MTTTLTAAIQSSLKYLLLIVIGMALGFFLRGGNLFGLNPFGLSGCGKSPEPVLVTADPTTQARAEYRAAKDTSYSVFEMPFKTHLKPRVIYKQKASEQYSKETLRKDLVTGIRAERSELSVFTFNPNDSTVKEYKFENPGRQFTLQTQNGNIFVKSNDFYFRTLMLNAEFRTASDNYDWQNVSKNIGLKSRLEWKDKVELEAAVKYDVQKTLSLKNVEINLQLNYTLIK